MLVYNILYYNIVNVEQLLLLMFTVRPGLYDIPRHIPRGCNKILFSVKGRLHDVLLRVQA